MSDPTFAQKDAGVVLAEALEVYTGVTGVTLAPADPKRLHLQALLLLVTQLRGLIDYSGKQNLVRYVGDLWIDALAELLAAVRLAAGPSRVNLRFSKGAGPATVAVGKRVTNGGFLWAVESTVVAATDAVYVDAIGVCTVNGSASNAVAPTLIDTLVDTIPNVTGVSNTTQSVGGRDLETVNPFRDRLRSISESRSTAGPGVAYIALAMNAAPEVADAVVIGADDDTFLAGATPGPGEVKVLVIEGVRNVEGQLVSVIPEPSLGVLGAVEVAVTDDRARPFTDSVSRAAPSFVDVDISATYYIARSRREFVADIQAAVEAAFDAYTLWQQSKIGRDINPDQLVANVVGAGAKRLVVTLPAYAALKRDESARLVYQTLIYGGLQDD